MPLREEQIQEMQEPHRVIIIWSHGSTSVPGFCVTWNQKSPDERVSGCNLSVYNFSLIEEIYRAEECFLWYHWDLIINQNLWPDHIVLPILTLSGGIYIEKKGLFLKEEEEFSTEWIKHKVWLNSMNSYYKSDLHNCACDLVDLYFIIPFGVQLCSEAEDQSYWNMWVFDNLYQCKNKNEKKEMIKHGDIIINILKMYFPLWFDSYLLRATCL